MNIYQKKVVKEKEYIFKDECIQTKSTYPNSKPDIDSDITSYINKRQFNGINSNKEKNERNNRHQRSKSQIMNSSETYKKYIPKAIKTVLIKFKKPIGQNLYNTNDFDYKTNYSNKFYKNKNSFEINTLEIKELLYKKDDIEINNKINNNLFSLYAPYKEKKSNKFTRNKSVILESHNKKNNYDNSINKSFITIYKKSYCLDKQSKCKGYLKNKENSKQNSKMKINKSCNDIKNNKNEIINMFNRINKKDNFNNNNNCNKIGYIKVINSNYNEEVKICKNKEDIISKKKKQKIKNIPQLIFKNDIDNKEIPQNLFYNRHINNYQNTNKIIQHKNKVLTFEEPINDIYSMRNYAKNKGNLLNIVSEQATKRDEDKNSDKKEINNFMSKIRKNKLKENNENLINKKKQIKIKGKKMLRSNSTKIIETENNKFDININKINEIKSIPLKFKNSGTNFKNFNNNYINGFINAYNIKNKNKIDSNIVLINKGNYNLWNNLIIQFP